MKTNTIGSIIIDNRFVGKTQINADDLGGVNCGTWQQYCQLCDNIVIAAYSRLHGKGVDSDTLGMSVMGLFELFGVDAKATPEYQNRLMVAVIERKAIRSDKLKQATKAKSEAKTKWEDSISIGADETTQDKCKKFYEEKCEELDALYSEPKNYYFEQIPMLDRTRKHATAKARKSIEDILADIMTERDMMTIEELQAEAQRLADERKGRAIRKKDEKKATKSNK